MTDLERCYAAAIRILRYRFNSAVELRRKLSAKDFDRDTIRETIERLTAEKWIDDQRFSEAFVRSRMRKGVGPLRIRRELTAAGVSDDAAHGALQSNRDEDAEREAATALANRRVSQLVRRRGVEYLVSREGRSALHAFLHRQGFDSALIDEVVREAIRLVRSS
jgi:regulatory protein